jgi:hypothetical protein
MEMVADEVFTYEEVLQLREVVTGSSLNVSQHKHCFMWCDRGDVRATFVKTLPLEIWFQGEYYCLQNSYLGDWDILVDSQMKMVGFFLKAKGKPALFDSDFAMQRNVSLHHNNLYILLRVHEAFEIKRLGAMGTRCYRSQSGKFMLCMPQWVNWGAIYFPLTHDKMPQILR